MLTKRALRNKILLRLQKQKEEDRDRKSRIIKNKLFKTLVFKKAKTVMFYIAFDGEVDTQDMITQAHKLGKIIAVPVCRAKREMAPCLLKENSKLVRGLYGISEPAIKRPLEPQDLDLVVVPGVAFDKQGRRLGRGKGYYDRFLGKVPPHIATLGLAFDFQVLPAIPVTKRDIRVQKLIFA